MRKILLEENLSSVAVER